ncbi:MAG: beta-phosphoglucomutase [Chloroflexota bacterium]
MKTKKYQAALFDLDGVLVDTTRYHYTALKNLADQYGFDFSEKDNERFKGISQARALDNLFEFGGIKVDDFTKARLLAQKQVEYISFIEKLDGTDLFPGAKECLQSLRARGVKIALGSSGKHARMILEKLEILALFDALIDGNKVTKTKPDPQVFLLGAEALGVSAVECVVFEDAVAGVQAAKAVGMFAVGIGQPEILSLADIVVAGLYEFDVDTFFLGSQ